MATLNEFDFGTDTAAVEQYIEDLKTNLIDACSEAMRTNSSELKGKISSYWNGVSADRFMNSYDQTINSATEMLSELKNALNNYMITIKNSVLNTEASLWNETENPFSGSSDASSHKWSE